MAAANGPNNTFPMMAELAEKKQTRSTNKNNSKTTTVIPFHKMANYYPQNTTYSTTMYNLLYHPKNPAIFAQLTLNNATWNSYSWSFWRAVFRWPCCDPFFMFVSVTEQYHWAVKNKILLFFCSTPFRYWGLTLTWQNWNLSHEPLNEQKTCDAWDPHFDPKNCSSGENAEILL